MIGGSQRIRRLTGLSVLSLAEQRLAPVRLPAARSVSMPAWAPDGRRFAVTADGLDGIAVWVGDALTASAAPVPGLRVRDVLGGDPIAAGSTVRWSRDGRSLLALAAPGGPQELPATSQEPAVAETAGKHSQMATFQDLLRTRADCDAFETLATTVPVRADPVTGATTVLGPPGLYYRLSDSPDGRHLLVHRLRRPFSFRVPYPYFSRTVEVWAADGTQERVVAELPVSDEVPRQGSSTCEATGPAWTATSRSSTGSTSPTCPPGGCSGPQPVPTSRCSASSPTAGTAC